MLFSEFDKHLPNSEEHLLRLKTRLKDLAYNFVYRFPWVLLAEELFSNGKNLKTKTDICTNKPDKSEVVVIINYSNYVHKIVYFK